MIKVDYTNKVLTYCESNHRKYRHCNRNKKLRAKTFSITIRFYDIFLLRRISKKKILHFGFLTPSILSSSFSSSAVIGPSNAVQDAENKVMKTRK